MIPPFKGRKLFSAEWKIFISTIKTTNLDCFWYLTIFLYLSIPKRTDRTLIPRNLTFWAYPNKIKPTPVPSTKSNFNCTKHGKQISTFHLFCWSFNTTVQAYLQSIIRKCMYCFWLHGRNYNFSFGINIQS